MVSINFIIIYSFTLTSFIISENFTVEYYLKLIEKNQQNALKFQLPVNYSEFEAGDLIDYIDYGEFDFIIVGAGSAGSVLASRLSEVTKWNILLLDAGEEENDYSDIPAQMLFFQFSKMNWGHFSVPQKNCCLGMLNQQCHIPRGKVLGGSSTLGSLIYSRGNKQDYNLWGQQVNDDWKFDKVLSYFKKSENSEINGDLGFHKKYGLLNVAYSEPDSDLLENFLGAQKEIGMNIIDYNGDSQIGTGKTQYNINGGKRQSSSRAFLDHARDRYNLNVTIKAFVTKILFNKRKHTKGVHFHKYGKKYVAKVRKEVILSAGAINSPQLLMLSGIGPKRHLKDIDIPVLVNLPVGENLQDDPMFLGLNFRTNYTHLNINWEDVVREYLQGKGELTSAGHISAISSICANNISGYPLFHYDFIPPVSTSPIIGKVYNYNDQINKNFVDKFNRLTDFSIYLILLESKSSGKITLKSKNPFEFPNIDLNLLSDSKDLQNMRLGIKIAFDMINTQSFKKLNPRFQDYPICNEFGKFSNSYWNCALRHFTSTNHNLRKTTVMGKHKSNSVVDFNLKVHGVKNLRVVDAGVIPKLTGKTNAPTIMIAEKIADIIKNHYGIRILENSI